MGKRRGVKYGGTTGGRGEGLNMGGRGKRRGVKYGGTTGGRGEGLNMEGGQGEEERG